MPLPITIPYTFATATTSIPLSQLDSDFSTVVNAINGIGNGSNALTAANITGGTITNVTITSLVAPLAVNSGGTGLANITLDSVMVGNGTNAVKVVAPGTTGNVLTSDGTTWLSQAPAAVTAVSNISFGTTGLTPNTATTGAVTVAGVLVVANGGTGGSNAATAATNLGLGTGNNVTFNTVSDAIGNVRQVPLNSQTSAYILAASDVGKCVSITTGGITVPNGIFGSGDTVTIYNNSNATQNIANAVSVTLRQVGTANTGTRTLAQYGLATILCTAANNFVITGGGLA